MIGYLIVKLVGKCNLACGYCYYMNDLDDAFQMRMSLQSVLQMQNRYAEYARRRGIQRVSLCWHGGEPTLIGKRAFQSILEAQIEAFGPDITVRNLLQTNATLIDAEWADLFVRHDVSVGVSLDGTEEAHDRARPFKSGGGSYQKTVQGLQVLAAHGVRFGTLTVPNPRMSGAEVFRHHYALGIRHMDFTLPVADATGFTREFGMDGAQGLLAYMRGVFDAWLETDDPDVRIGSLENLVKLVAGGKSGHCTTSNRCSGYVTIEPNGDAGLCENMRMLTTGVAAEQDPYLLGLNVETDDFDAIETAVMAQFRQSRINVLSAQCTGCAERSICNGGCSVHRYRDSGGFQNPSYLCDMYRGLIHHIRQTLYAEQAVA